MKNQRIYTYFEFKAASFYYQDVKLHLLTNQADSGFCLQKGEWDIGIKNPIEELNFHELWEELDETSKKTYRSLAHHDLYSENEKDLYTIKTKKDI